MKRAIIFLLVIAVVCFGACSKKNRIAPVSGTINGKPAISLYGSSNEPTDYVLIDTIIADRKLLYDGIVFSYIYSSIYSNNIFVVGPTVPVAAATLSITASKITLTIDTTYSITFGSKLYTSN